MKAKKSPCQAVPQELRADMDQLIALREQMRIIKDQHKAASDAMIARLPKNTTYGIGRLRVRLAREEERLQRSWTKAKWRLKWREVDEFFKPEGEL